MSVFLVQGLLFHSFHIELKRWLSSVFPHNFAKAKLRLLHRSHCTTQCALVGRPGAQKVSMVLLSKHTNTGHCPHLSTILVKSGTSADSNVLFCTQRGPSPTEGLPGARQPVRGCIYIIVNFTREVLYQSNSERLSNLPIGKSSVSSSDFLIPKPLFLPHF